MRLAAVSLAWPRMEWPFVFQWCRYLVDNGATEFFIGQHDRQDLVWEKRPNPNYYHPDASEAKIREHWEAALQQCRAIARVTTIPVPAGELRMAKLQRSLFKEARRLSLQRGVEWLISCDIDEFPVACENQPLCDFLVDLRRRRPRVSVAHWRQMVFESRWDTWNQYCPRDLSQPCSFNPKVVQLHKYAYRPSEAIPIGPHQATPIDDSTRSIVLPASRLISHHFRGIEKANHPQLQSIQTLPRRTDNPLSWITRD